MVSVTMFWEAAPSAVSMASANSSSVRKRFATGAWTPRSVPCALSRITLRTALEKPSYSRSMSSSRRMRASMVRPSTARRLAFSVSVFSACSRLVSFMRQPSIALRQRPASSRQASSSRPISRMRSCVASIFFCTSRTRFSCSAMSPSMRALLSSVLLQSARRTAASASQRAASASAALSRARASSVSTSLRCMRSLMPSDEA